MDRTEVDYGVDAPGVVRNLVFLGIAGIALIVASMRLLGPASVSISVTGVIALVVGFGESTWMLYGSRKGKYLLREVLLDCLRLQGSEEVLDVGCGRGLVLIGAARRLTSGRATGLDIWQRQDQSGNDPRVTLANAAAEGAGDRILVQSGDMREMPFAAATFDAVVSSLAIHNVSNAEGRATALKEIDRVLKPGGRAALLDFVHVAQYAKELHELGWRDVSVTPLQFAVFPPARIISGTKPSPTKRI